MNKYQVQGRAEAAKGKVEYVAGKIVGNKDLAQKGKADEATGKVQAIAGDAKEALKRVTTPD